MNNLSEIQKAYIAGIIDGEGSITLDPNGKFRRPSVQVTSTDLELIFYLNQICGVGIIHKNKVKSDKHNQSWTWFVRSKAACQLLQQIEKYMVIKKKHERAKMLAYVYPVIVKPNGYYNDQELLTRLKFQEDFYKV